MKLPSDTMPEAADGLAGAVLGVVVGGPSLAVRSGDLLAGPSSPSQAARSETRDNGHHAPCSAKFRGIADVKAKKSCAIPTTSRRSLTLGISSLSQWAKGRRDARSETTRLEELLWCKHDAFQRSLPSSCDLLVQGVFYCAVRFCRLARASAYVSTACPQPKHVCGGEGRPPCGPTASFSCSGRLLHKVANYGGRID
ncbi:hypothetical protein BCV69DRAFT_112867 [Microstroma glucosiphilum]|uniref:Uncharacterized protein n=1 Tax=Pseudomicrostroma glucosiphilum TaxID=1684307 RepID=A0A316UJ59_9BASI|nr:hypothetical protein BCV69DRAFT_112867 [Pseudomicrostroma glucosiphilum]PWN23235.1 hypothetical protein BCV69DRAFT_112867 [Pseudomicrostroma glucosiphilum]